ncbi:hypothetical protein PUNSTDRAFT_135409 [Punctularia strigosozonata HHB-11173 SS5]|uniref:uncharacterized protein n=1 Tax=Punctularia strigosozonata (strain HHB-11173) TaxID=741275 RepID=UPI0004418331|nr:uncharacterized protein PUNSTDRAFT_135409 [Punctularia strigosozonata HHB-11173 SS5]EIN07887.1 hypothetical protein PUNSTDRAFT_135409 [Punctularia strigosozonata HHB-11173 SS5]
MMMVGLRKTRYPGKLWNLAYKQGIVWTLVPVLLEIPNVIFLVLDLNDVISVVFETVFTVFLAIVVTRIYRDMSEFSPGPNERVV